MLLKIICLGLVPWLATPAAAEPASLELAGYQSDDGAIGIFNHGDQVDPYFANKALLTAQDAGLDISRTAGAWINWGLRRQRPDGGFDRYCQRNGVLIACQAADADDASAAVWMELLAKQAPAEGLPPAWQASLKRAGQLLDSLYDKSSRIYFISASQQTGLLMDNVEVYSALLAMGRLYARLGDISQSLAYTGRADYLANNIYRVFWQPCKQQFRASTQLNTSPGFYPDKVAEVFPLLPNMQVPGLNEADFFREWLAENQAQWFSNALVDYPWGLIAIAAEKMQQYGVVNCWLALAKQLRTGSHWDVLEEAAFQALESRSPSVPKHNSCPAPVTGKKPARLGSPGDLIVFKADNHAVELRWNAPSGEARPLGYEIFRDSQKIDASPAPVFIDKTVVPGSAYVYAVRAFDISQNRSELSPPVSVQTPTGNTATIYFAANWPRAIIRFQVQGAGNGAVQEAVMEDACPHFKIKTLDIGSAQVVTVSFKDGAGAVDDNRGGGYQVGAGVSGVAGGLISPETDPCLDGEAPSRPEGLSQVAVDGVNVRIAWRPATDNNPGVRYKVYRNGAEIAETQGAEFADFCVSPITTYQYRIRSIDSSENQSPYSDELIVTTLYKP